MRPLSRATVWRKSWLYAEMTALIPITATVGSILGLTLGIIIVGLAAGLALALGARALVAWVMA